MQNTLMREYIDIDPKKLYNITNDGKEVENMEVVLSPKYQVVIPREIRENLKLKKNQKLAVIVKNGVISLIPIPSLDELRGMAKGIEIKQIREEGERI